MKYVLFTVMLMGATSVSAVSAAEFCGKRSAWGLEYDFQVNAPNNSARIYVEGVPFIAKSAIINKGVGSAVDSCDRCSQEEKARMKKLVADRGLDVGDILTLEKSGKNSVITLQNDRATFSSHLYDAMVGYIKAKINGQNGQYSCK